MSVIPCQKNAKLDEMIDAYADALKVEAHKLGTHGLSEKDFYDSGLFRAVIEKIRGEYSATMRWKREFAQHVLNHMQDRGFIQEWESAGEANRYDYDVTLPGGRIAAIEMKGCLDGNNTNIFERPAHAQEFVIWSVCTSPGADPRHNTWSGLHTRLSAEIIVRHQRVDGLIIWDMVCGTIGRPCPKLEGAEERITTLGHYRVPPACIYVFPATVPAPRNNPHPSAQEIDDVQMLKAFHNCFGGRADEINYVDFDVEYRNSDTVRRTRIRRAGAIVRESKLTAIRRT